jgi:HK97 family phage major capsid protein
MSGGFLVPEAFSDVILTTLYEDRTSILSYLQRFNIPEGSNTLRVPGVDETSRANGYRWGGVLADFVDEGTVEAPEFPRYKSTQFAAEKLIGYVVLTNELMADVENLDTFLRRAIADELRYKLEQYILSSAGTGAGRPLSVLNSPALVTVAKTSAQASGTLTELNLRTMLYALPAPSRRRAIWAASESAMELVENFEAVTRPASGSTNPDDLPRIKGRPVIETDVLPAVGTPGDVLLIDPAWYGFASKPMASALSAHVLFTSDQAVLRVVWRCAARPLVSAPIAATDGASRSAFVALAAR